MAYIVVSCGGRSSERLEPREATAHCASKTSARFSPPEDSFGRGFHARRRGKTTHRNCCAVRRDLERVTSARVSGYDCRA